MGCDRPPASHRPIALGFNSRTPCGVRPASTFTAQLENCFNSRTPCGVRLLLGTFIESPFWVSIHAPRVGCDRHQERVPARERRFNSRTPCGVRPGKLRLRADDPAFQFTHPVWGATTDSPRLRDVTRVSIHAPRVGCDGEYQMPKMKKDRFNSRTPCGVRQDHRQETHQRQLFQFTHPVWGATAMPKGTH